MTLLGWTLLGVVVAIALGLAYDLGLRMGQMRAYRAALHRLDRAMAEDRRLFLMAQSAHNYRGALVEGAFGRGRAR